MKKIFIYSIAIVSITLLFTGCECFKKMVKEAGKVSVKCDPKVLTLKGDSVMAEFTVTFPGKFFGTQVKLEVTPVLKSLLDTTFEMTAPPTYLQGEKVKDNFTIISYKAGGSYKQRVAFKFDPKMRRSVLELRVRACCKSESFEDSESKVAVFPGAFKVAEGVSMIQSYVNKMPRMDTIVNHFERIKKENISATLHFLVGKSDVRKEEAALLEFKKLDTFLTKALKDPKKSLKGVSLLGYASPEGSADLNNKLSKERSESTRDVLSSNLTNRKLSTGENMYTVASQGEDWKGFKEAVLASDMRDKELVIKVLEMYSDLEVREKEIRKIAEVYSTLKKDILPKQRRARATVNVDVEGLTDKEFLKLVATNNLDSLTVEELLFCAGLVKEQGVRAKVLDFAVKKYTDYRVFNNLGVANYNLRDLDKAKGSIRKAADLDPSKEEIKTNMGALDLLEDNFEGAKRLLSPLASMSAKYNIGIVYTLLGEYALASSNLSDTKSYNYAVAELLNGNIPECRSTISTFETPESYYLKAIVAAKEGQDDIFYTELGKALNADREKYLPLTLTEVEFLVYAGAEKFIALVK